MVPGRGAWPPQKPKTSGPNFGTEGLRGLEEDGGAVIRGWRKATPLCPAGKSDNSVTMKTENISHEPVDWAPEISRRNVESTNWLIFATCDKV